MLLFLDSKCRVNVACNFSTELTVFPGNSPMQNQWYWVRKSWIESHVTENHLVQLVHMWYITRVLYTYFIYVYNIAVCTIFNCLVICSIVPSNKPPRPRPRLKGSKTKTRTLRFKTKTLKNGSRDVSWQRLESRELSLYHTSGTSWH